MAKQRKEKAITPVKVEAQQRLERMRRVFKEGQECLHQLRRENNGGSG